MLTLMRIKNFKSWKDTGDIALKPITVLFGPNSSGKSSINQFILMLKQTAQSPDRQRVLHPGDDKTPIYLGDFKEMVHGHKEDEHINFSWEWDAGEASSVKDVVNNKEFVGRTIAFSADIHLSQAPRRTMIVEEMKYRLGDPSHNGLEIGMKRKESKSNGSKDKVEFLSQLAKFNVEIDDQIVIRSREIHQLGFAVLDSFHIACAEKGNADVLLTTDDRLVQRAAKYGKKLNITVANPLKWLMEMMQK